MQRQRYIVIFISLICLTQQIGCVSISPKIEEYEQLDTRGLSKYDTSLFKNLIIVFSIDDKNSVEVNALKSDIQIARHQYDYLKPKMEFWEYMFEYFKKYGIMGKQYSEWYINTFKEKARILYENH